MGKAILTARHTQERLRVRIHFPPPASFSHQCPAAHPAQNRAPCARHAHSAGFARCSDHAGSTDVLEREPDRRDCDPTCRRQHLDHWPRSIAERSCGAHHRWPAHLDIDIMAVLFAVAWRSYGLGGQVDPADERGLGRLACIEVAEPAREPRRSGRSARTVDRQGAPAATAEDRGSSCSIWIRARARPAASRRAVPTTAISAAPATTRVRVQPAR
jgi:hypothetical protein